MLTGSRVKVHNNQRISISFPQRAVVIFSKWIFFDISGVLFITMNHIKTTIENKKICTIILGD